MAKVRIDPITSEVLRAAKKRANETRASGAIGVRLDGDHLIVDMRSGASAAVPVRAIPVTIIAEAPLAKLSNVELGEMGDYIWFPDVDEGYNVSALLDIAFGSAIRAGIGKRGGSQTSVAKAAASRANGARGGRPKSKA